MSGGRYALASLDEAEWAGGDRTAGTAPLTEPLGCQHTTVDGLRLQGDESVALPSSGEQVCVPVETTQPLELNGTVTVPPDGVGRIPAGVTGSVSCAGSASVVVVGAPAPSASNASAVAVSLDDREFALPSTSEVATARLTEALGCRGMKLNARLLEPGQVVPYHTEGDQEELFVPLARPASMRIADTTYETPPGTVARVAPEVPRSACNEGDTDAVWVMVGAPPTGGPEEWDPGAEILE